jgi:hypothetical protein
LLVGHGPCVGLYGMFTMFELPLTGNPTISYTDDIMGHLHCAYGYNLLNWPGWGTLRDISEAQSLASYIRSTRNSSSQVIGTSRL